MITNIMTWRALFTLFKNYRYASGGGYVVTVDVARLFGHPPLPLKPQTVEDRRVGIVLYGFNVTYIDAMQFHPWGHW